MAKPIIWCIGGSDSGGGAGVQADLLTVQALGGHGCTVVSAITAQNSVAVTQVQAVPIEVLSNQLNALASDLWPGAVKIGMLGDASQIAALAEFLHWMKQQPKAPLIIWDPVARASCGSQLAALQLADCAPLLRLLDLITPNANELALLTGIEPTDAISLAVAANVLLEQGVGAVLVKGGHLHWAGEESQDWYLSPTKQWRFASSRIDTPHGHGTGCTFASAIATTLCLDYPMDDAICIAKAYINQGLKGAVALGQGPGPVAHLGWPVRAEDFPAFSLLADPPWQHSGFASVDSQSLGLYPVVDSLEWLEKLLGWGVRTLQLRIKQALTPELEEQIAKAVALGRQANARLFINDHWQLAIKLGAYGVHLGQEDLQQADLAAIYQAGLRLGISTHGYAEIQRARALKPSYIALGHIFPTRTKDMPSKPQGVARLAHYVRLLKGMPTVAIGGISLERVEAVAATGVGSIAMVTAITEASNPEQVVKDLLARWQNA
ncbi:thiamine phosphate synthase [Bowmanella sp. Y26]|uniref:thiamine phosphate synthase n=1 Tax=Bowmanella yangjiangensis TaxID=2811230 RepID=UPI001BDC8036|nr:thiamine phosphate synthase [Bowmanella yangjiangensis]MBT1062619.1 thiamine phosphate synthase [Bowmanella yangjiangensis]